MKLFLKSLLAALIIFFIGVIVKESIMFCIILSINFFIIYFALAFFYEKLILKMLNKFIGK